MLARSCCLSHAARSLQQGESLQMTVHCLEAEMKADCKDL